MNDIEIQHNSGIIRVDESHVPFGGGLISNSNSFTIRLDRDQFSPRNFSDEGSERYTWEVFGRPALPEQCYTEKENFVVINGEKIILEKVEIFG